jgi:L-amino acid N-acyltransferase YncA
MMDYSIRPATLTDAAQILNIYQPYITSSSITFEEKIPSLEEFSLRIQNGMKLHPWLVAEKDNQIIGYAYASKFRERESYRWSCELSLYIIEEFQNKGVAQQLYGSIIDIVKQQGYAIAIAVITLPNEKSVRFHEKIGFKQLFIFPKIGYKLNRWHDVLWMSLTLQPHNLPPAEIIPFSKFTKDLPNQC